jgi:putative SOS response-associated peptidase YedK
MCGRFILDASPDQLVAHFNLDQAPALTARYNIAPSQVVAVVAPKADPTKRGLALLKWGLVSSTSGMKASLDSNLVFAASRDPRFASNGGVLTAEQSSTVQSREMPAIPAPYHL